MVPTDTREIRSSIAVIGAQGHFGSALSQHLIDMGKSVTRSADKDHNIALTSEADVLMLTVQPQYVADVLREVSGSLLPHAVVVSFAAIYPLASIQHLTKRPCARIMTDPWWSISAYSITPDFKREGMDYVFKSFTKYAPRELQGDDAMNEFSVLISYVFAATLLARSGEVDTEAHVRFVCEHPYISRTREELFAFAPQGDVEEQLRTLATKGGITERIVALLRAKSGMEPEDLFNTVVRSVHERTAALTQSDE